MLPHVQKRPKGKLALVVGQLPCRELRSLVPSGFSAQKNTASPLVAFSAAPLRQDNDMVLYRKAFAVGLPLRRHVPRPDVHRKCLVRTHALTSWRSPTSHRRARAACPAGIPSRRPPQESSCRGGFGDSRMLVHKSMHWVPAHRAVSMRVCREVWEVPRGGCPEGCAH